MSQRPDPRSLIGRPVSEVPMSLQRVLGSLEPGERAWIGPEHAGDVGEEELKVYAAAHQVLLRLCIEAPTLHKSGHPGGPLSSFTFTYEVNRRRNPAVDPPFRMSAGHLSLLAYTMEWLFGRDGGDPRLASPEAIMEHFRTTMGLPGHAEAGVGDIPFGAGPLGKGVSNALGVAFALQYLRKPGHVDVLMADGDSQEGQIMEAFRLASRLKTDQLIVHGDWNDIQLSGIPSRTVASDFASIAASAGWSVIEVQNGNDLAQVKAALDVADAWVGKGHPIFVCYYTTMGYGVKLMEDGSNTGRRNFHGTPLGVEDTQAALAALPLPPFPQLSSRLEAFRSERKQRFDVVRRKRASAHLPFSLPEGWRRTVATEPGAARKDFGAVHLKALMAIDPRIVILHADLAESGGFGVVEKAFPDRVINVGVAEANMVMMAAGMRQAGLLPVTYTFAAFGTNEARASVRLVDINTGHVPLGILHDCTHAGLSVGEDGETHQERNYLNLPFDHTQVWVPADSNQGGAMAERALTIIAQGSESVYVFSPRSSHPQLLTGDGKPVYGVEYRFDGHATVVRGHGDPRDEATIFSYGIALHEVLKAADLLERRQRRVRVVNMACIRPLDSGAVIKAALETQHLLVVEDHNAEGGLATQMADLIADLALPCTLKRIGVRHYHPSGPDKELLLLAGIDAEHIASIVEDQFTHRLAGGEEVFVACIYGLVERLPATRFAVLAVEYVEFLQTNPGYLATLRELWNARALPAGKLPDDATLLQLLGQFRLPLDINSLTGAEREPQKDIGIV